MSTLQRLALVCAGSTAIACADSPDAGRGDTDGSTADATSPSDTSGSRTSADPSTDVDADSGASADPSDTAATACGNGIVDADEECDGSACCDGDCRLASVRTICRAAADACDVVETCSGTSDACPADARVAVEGPAVLPSVVMARAGTYPRATQLADGALLGVYEYYDGATDSLVLGTLASDDGASTWAPLGTVASEPATPGRSLANPHAVQLADGTVLVAFRHHDPAPTGVNYRLLVSASADLGASFSFRGEIETFASSTVGIWEPFLFVTPGGQLQAYYAKERAPSGQDIVVRESSDSGASWGGERIVASAAGSRDGMPGVTTLLDGSLVAVFESFRDPGINDRFAVRLVMSNDDGQTWAHRQIVFATLDAQRDAGAPQVTTLEDGRLAVTFMSDDGAAASDWPNNAATYVMVSEGVPSYGAIAWVPEPIVAAPASSYWPGLARANLRDPLVVFAQSGVRSTFVCLP